MHATPVPGASGPLRQRRIARHELSAWLRVFNAYSGQPMGLIGNVSCNGMMMISPLPVMIGEVFDMQLRLPCAADEPQLLNFRAVSHWCRPDLTPGHYDSGFSIVTNQQAFAELALALERYFSFLHPVDA